MMKVSQQVKEAYDHIAPTFANVNAEMPLELATLANDLIRLIGMPSHILDVGCGAGRDIAWFESHGVKITGADLSSGMLKEAQRHTHSNLLQMEMQYLGFRTRSFNAVWVNASLLHLPKQEVPRALNEFRRVLIANGILILTLQEGSGETWEGGYVDVEGVQRFFARYNEAEMRSLLAKCSFVVRESRTSHQGKKIWLQFVCVAC